MTRLRSDLLVSAMLRRANDAGGFGVVRARGEGGGGAILVIATDAGATVLLERGVGPTGPQLIESPAGDSVEEYWRRRRARDPDLWVIELDIPRAKRLVAETLGLG